MLLSKLSKVITMRSSSFIIDNSGDVPCEGEEALMMRMRNMAGPSASEGILRHQLRSSRGKHHWAINSYMRLVLSPIDDTRLDYEPQLVLARPQISQEQQLATHVHEEMTRDEGVEGDDPAVTCPSVTSDSCPLSDWSPTLVSLILEKVDDPWTLTSASAINKSFLKAARNDKLWRDLFDSRWGSEVFPLKAAERHLREKGPLELYRYQSLFVYHMSCPVCGEERGLVPIVYGFPSAPLMEMRRNKRCILGGDHLIEDCFVWGCVMCNVSFKAFPYSPPFDWIPRVNQAASPAAQVEGQRAYTYEL